MNNKELDFLIQEGEGFPKLKPAMFCLGRICKK
jgi:hypothetical protein